MKFTKLKIGSRKIKEHQAFYGELLGFKALINNDDELVIEAGTTQLIFSHHIGTPKLYHFAFLIPTGSLEASIAFVESKPISLLPFRGDKIIHFDTGRSIYFYDPDGNIAEFIERPLLGYPSKNDFEINHVICINEIGLPVSNPLAVSSELMTQHGIIPINKNTWNDNFCWVGDHEGAIIVVKEGRHWLPTEISGVCNDFELGYTENNASYKIQCKSGKLFT